MATIRHPLVAPQHVAADDHRVFHDTFNQHECQALIEDDLVAGRTVCGVLIAIVVGGLLLGIMAVLLAS